MIRRGLGMAIAAVVVTAALAAGPGGGAEPARAGTAPCVWHDHSSSRVVWQHRTHASLVPHRHVDRRTKRVVRSVFRTPTGHWHRVVRVRHWRTCDPVAPGRLQVTAREWSYLLSRPEVEDGDVIVELVNEGEDAHNLHLQLADGSGPDLSIGDVESEQRDEGRFTMAAGSYRLWCSLPAHEVLGMSSTLIVR